MDSSWCLVWVLDGLSPVADLIAFCLGDIIAVACPCVTVRALM